MSRKVFVTGVGMIPFAKPGASAPYDEMGALATRAALDDAGVAYDDIEQAYAGYVYGDSTSGQKALYQVGLTGIPIVNVNNNCSTGSTALFLARQAIASGAAECVLVLGFEQMSPGALGSVFNDRPSPFDPFDAVTDKLVGMPEIPLALRYFGGAGLQHMKKYGTPFDAFAKIRAKASRHAVNNPLALFRKEVTAQDVLDAPMIWPGVMTRLMACPPTCGAAAAVLVSEEFAKKHSLKRHVYIAAQAMTTDRASTFDSDDMMRVVGYDMSREAAAKVYAQSGIGPDELDVVELHDCFAHNELITYEALGLCPEGGADKFISDGDNTYGGKVVTNPSGGLLSKGHPLGATGLAQCYELTHQLRATAGARQVEGARVALQHNLGLGGACVVTMYRGGVMNSVFNAIGNSAWMNAELEGFRDAVRRFVGSEIVPNQERWRKQQHVDRELWNKGGEMGILCADIPEQYGGSGGSFAHQAVVFEELGYVGDMSFGIHVHAIVAHYILNQGTEAQKLKYLPKLASGEMIAAIAMSEPGAGSDLKGIRTTAVKDGDGYSVNGSKTFISNGYLADLIAVVVKTDPQAGHKGVSLLLLETKDNPGFRVGRILEKVGQKGQDTCELFFDNARVPLDNVLGGVEGKGFAQLMTELPYERTILGVSGVAAIERALQLTVDYTRERKAFGQTLMDMQNTRFVLAEIKTEATVARIFIDRCIEDTIAGSMDTVRASMAKYWISDLQCKVIDQCVQLFGGYGYMLEYPIAQMYVDARVQQRIYGGANEIMKEIIARSL